MKLMEKAKDKKFWEKVRTTPEYKFMVDELLDKYERECLSEIEALKYSKYKIYFEGGSRKEYEDEYFDRRRRMNILALLSLIYPENDEYIEKLQDVLWAILDEYCWALPAHVHDNCTNDNTFIDLFAAETGMTLSEILYFLEDRLAPLIKNRIKAEIDRRIINSYIERKDEYWWDINCDNNWAAVCAGSVGTTFIYMRPELFDSVKPRIDADMKRFSNGFYADGVCREGIEYWSYGFGFYIFYNDILKQFSDGKYDCFKDEHIKSISLFHQKSFLQEDVTTSFADGSMNTKYNIGIINYLKSLYPEIEVPPTKYAYTSDYCGRWFFHSRSFIYFNPEYLAENNKGDEIYYMNESQWFVKKSNRLAFAAKGGDNDEPHNHNDIGEFIVAAGGKQILCDLGAGEYTRQYFTPSERYTIFCNSSLGHSVPAFDGIGQKEGKEYKGKTSYENGIFRVDMTGAYSIEKLKSLVRTFDIGEDIIMKDEISLSEETEINERVITMIEPKVMDSMVIVDNLKLEYDSNEWRVDIKVQKHSNHQAKMVEVYCIDFLKKANNAVFILKISL